MPRVNIDTIAFTDGRFDDLAEFAKLANRHEALGRMAALWHACVLTGRSIMRASEVERYLGELGPTALVKSALGELAGDSIRIKGCSGRTEAWKPSVAAQTAGGKKRAENAVRIGGKFIKTAGFPLAKTAIEPVGQNGTTDEDLTRTSLESSPYVTSKAPASPPASPPASDTSKTSIKPAKSQQGTSITSFSGSRSRSLSEILEPAPNKKVKNNAAAGSNSPSCDPTVPATGTNLAPAWVPGQQQQQRCAALFLDLAGEVAKFRAHAARNKRQFENPDDAFTFWLEKSAERKIPQPPNPSRYGKPADAVTPRPRFQKLV